MIIDDDNILKQGVIRIRQKGSGDVLMKSLESKDHLDQSILRVQTKAIANITIKERGIIWHQILDHLNEWIIKES